MTAAECHFRGETVSLIGGHPVAHLAPRCWRAGTGLERRLSSEFNIVLGAAGSRPSAGYLGLPRFRLHRHRSAYAGAQRESSAYARAQ
jgi:hypothetical protein